MLIIRRGYLVFHITIVLLLFVNLYACNNSVKNNDTTEFLEYSELDSKKEKLDKGDKKQVVASNDLIKTVDSLLNEPVFSVMNKVGVPPSGNKHDYMSIGPYWWPNPETADGLPYIRKDGEINPETRNNYTDFVENENFINAIRDLRKAYFLSDKEVYANKALELIKAWFLEPDTKMNPNINYGQSIPGKNDGRCFGIIEFGRIVEVLKCLEFLDTKNILDDETKKGMESWFSEYAHWLQNSELGKQESTRTNNHGTLYDVQLLNILLYLKREDEVRNYLTSITVKRIFGQIEPNGSQPRELERTKSFSYSQLNLSGFMKLVRLGQKVGVNLWNVESEDGRSIKKGYQYMLPYLTKEKQWEYEQIEETKSSESRLIADLKYACKTFNDRSFDKVLQIINNKQNVKD